MGPPTNTEDILLSGLCVGPKPWPGFSTSYIVIICVQRVQLRWEVIVRFVDIGGIDGNHRLN